METSIEKFRGILKGNTLIVDEPQAIEWLKSRGYGSGEVQRSLKFHEALYLLEQNKLEVIDRKNKTLSFDELLRRAEKYDNKVLYKYLIYRDLRNRGYIVVDGYGLGIDFNVYERGGFPNDTPKILVFGLCEGVSISFEELIKVLKVAQANRKMLVLTVIDRRNEVVYYTISRLV
ncbi:MAG: tRNA-intron lyase [Thermoproteota archaeon]